LKEKRPRGTGAEVINGYMDEDPIRRLNQETQSGDPIMPHEQPSDQTPNPFLPRAGEHAGETLNGNPYAQYFDATVAGISEPIDFLTTPRAPALTRDLFPPIIADYAWPRALAAGHDPGVYAMAMMGAVAGASNDAIRLCLSVTTDYHERAGLWTDVLGSSSAAKTPAMDCAREPINKLQAELSIAYKDDKRVWDLHHPVRKKDPRTEKFDGPLTMTTAPVQKVVITSDTTIEALSSVLVEQPRGILVFHGELDQFIGSMDAYRGNGANRDRGYWLAAYDGGPQMILRVQRGTLFVPNWSASVVMAGTITALQRHAKNLKPDGLLARFLCVLAAEDGAPDRSISAEVVSKARDAYAARVRELLADERIEVAPVKLDAEAQKVFDQFFVELGGLKKAATEASEGLGVHIGKGAGHLGRLAITAHLAQYGLTDKPISGADMQRAQRLLAALWRHSAVLYRELLGGGSPAYGLAVALGKSILADGKATLRRTEMSHACRAWRDEEDERVRRSALEILVSMGWMTPEDDGRRYRGEVSTWIVHPHLHVLFAQMAQEHREFRRIVQQKILGAGSRGELGQHS
jgi:hypothetical protein